MKWHRATVVAARQETPDARTLVLRVDGWGGHLAGQHVDVQLTAPDGYSASRSYSIASAASAPASGDGHAVIEITVDRLADGEVSPYLVDEIPVGEGLEVRGPAGRYFTWDGGPKPVQLIAGGSGIVPLMSMIRTHRATSSSAPFRLLYSVRSPRLAIYRDELVATTAIDTTWAFTRQAPDATAPARLTLETLGAAVFPADADAVTYICGSTPFVETVANWLVDVGRDAAHIRTERFGG